MKKERKMILFLLLFLIYNYTEACPFYILFSERTNYTNFTGGMQDAITYAMPLHICEASVILEEETVPEIDGDLEVIGDTDEAGLGVYLNVLGNSQNPVFLLSGNADVSFRNLRIIFNHTLFKITENSELTLNTLKMMQGEVAIHSDPGVSNPDPIFFSEIDFVGLQYGVLLRSGKFYCKSCRFMFVSQSGIAMSTSDLTRLEIPRIQFQDVLTPIGVQATVDGEVSRLSLSSSFLLEQEVGDCHSYKEVCGVTQSASPTPVFGLGVGTGSNKNNSGIVNMWIEIAVLIVLCVLVILWVISFVGPNKINDSPNANSLNNQIYANVKYESF